MSFIGVVLAISRSAQRDHRQDRRKDSRDRLGGIDNHRANNAAWRREAAVRQAALLDHISDNG
jgi:hypothetical protein